MHPEWLNRFKDFFEKLVLWLVEGQRSPFARNAPQRVRMNPKRDRK
jgi:hypothetical protein